MEASSNRSPRTHHRWLGGGVLAVVLATLVAGGAWWASHRKPPEAAKPVVTLVFTPAEVVTPKLSPVPERIAFSGPLMAPRTAVVRSKASGTLLTLKVAEGSRVKAGESLGTIDLADLQTRAAERAAMVDSARARLAEAERTYTSNQDLARQNFISTNALAGSRASLEAAQAQLRSASAQLATSTVGIRDAALIAPIGGVIGRRSALPGEKVAAEQELLTIVDLAQLELAGVVGTQQVSLLRPGQPLEVQVEGTVAPVEGRIDRIAPMAEPGTRGIRVTVRLANPDERFRAGQYASAVVTLEDALPRLTVPAASLMPSPNCARRCRRGSSCA